MLSAATPQAASPQRARCRQIGEADLDGVADLLARGFPRSTRGTWLTGFERFRALPAVEGLPRFGYVLDVGGAIAGAILLIPSRRGARIYANLSSWYVEPAWRSHSTLLISMATKLKHVSYVNVSPAPHTFDVLKAQGFRQYVFGRSAVFAALGFRGGKVSDVIPDDLPERDLLGEHARMGCISLVCETDGVTAPFVFQRRKLDRPPAHAADLVFSRSDGDFRRCAAALGRWLLRRGMFAVIVDGRVRGMLSHYVDGKEPRYFKGPFAPTDLAFTEKVIFG